MSPAQARTRDRCRRAVLVLGIVVIAIPISGCAQTDSILSRRVSLGSLKTGMSHLEFENNQLKKKMAELKSINREVEDRLVQEESANGELKARLDNARNLLTERGRFDGSGDRVTDSSIDPEPEQPPRRTLPAGNSSKPKRKPPFARIGGVVELPSSDDSSAGGDFGGNQEPEPPIKLPPAPKSSRPPTDQRNSHDPTRWLPISRGVTDPSARR